MKKLERSFYNRPTLDVAKDLLGKIIVKKENDRQISCRIVEVEAYIGRIDKAAHCYNNKRTPRTEVMFGKSGVAYVYLIYGMYHCLNIVTEEEGEAAAVLIRAVEPVEGLPQMVKNRYNKTVEEIKKRELINLTSGPGKLCRAMAITMEDNKKDLCGDELFLIEENSPAPFDIVTTKRINIDYAEEAIDFPWRYYIANNPFISK